MTRRATSERSLAAIPTLDELAANPVLAAHLSHSVVERLLLGAILVQGALFSRLLVLHTDPKPSSSADAASENSAVGLGEAARTLGMKPSTLYKKWRALEIGYRDADGRVKFTRSSLHRYLLRKGG